MVKVPAVAEAAEGIGKTDDGDESRDGQLERGAIIGPASHQDGGQQAAEYQESTAKERMPAWVQNGGESDRSLH